MSVYVYLNYDTSNLKYILNGHNNLTTSVSYN